MPLFTFNLLGAGHTTMRGGKRLLVSVIQKTKNFLPNFTICHIRTSQKEFSTAFIENSDHFIEDLSKFNFFSKILYRPPQRTYKWYNYYIDEFFI